MYHHVIAVKMQIAQSWITFQFVAVIQATQEILNSDVSNLDVKVITNVPMTKHATTVNVSIHVPLKIHVQ